jgi:hypothetical protein
LILMVCAALGFAVFQDATLTRCRADSILSVLKICNSSFQ